MIAIVNIGQLVTLAGPARPRIGAELRELGLIPDAALLIEEGRITATGSYAEIKSQIPPHAVVVDAGGRCVTPGFVDAHTHLCFAGNRAAEFEQRIAGATYQEIAAAGGGILRTVALTRAATEDDLLASTRQHRDWMLRSGTTTIEAKSGYGLDWATELRMLQVLARLDSEGPARIVPTLLAAHTVPPEFAPRRADYVRWITDELIPEVAQRASRPAIATPSATTTPSPSTKPAASSLQPNSTAWACASTPNSFVPAPARNLPPNSAPPLPIISKPSPTKRCITCAAPPSSRSCCPAQSFRLSRTQYPPARRMVDLGLAIVVATDFNPGSSPIASMPFILSLSCLEMKLLPAEALTAATINAAYSLDLGNSIGSLVPGKQADFVIHEFDDYRELAYFIAASARPRVFVSGNEITF